MTEYIDRRPPNKTLEPASTAAALAAHPPADGACADDVA